MSFDFIKKNRITISLFTILGTLTTALVISTVSWFRANNLISDLNVTSGVVTNYYESGTGSSTNPFVIARPEQLFNLMYLQQSDKLVDDPNTSTVEQIPYYQADYYYQFGKFVNNKYLFVDYDDNGILAAGYGAQETYSPYLNMTYYSNENALIPIGSEAKPFNGHIVGNNLTVKNLVIHSNKQSDVGIFGYCGGDARISNAYFENVTIVLEKNGNTDFSKQGTEHNAGHAHDSNGYVGYICGHCVDADASFTDVYVNKCEIENTANNLSAQFNNEFGYFGHVNANQASPVGSDKHVQLKPSAVHEYFENSYETIKGKDYATRPNYSGYTGSGQVQSSISTATYQEDDETINSYSYGTNNSHNASLATSGYHLDDETLYYAAYYNNVKKQYNDLDPATTLLDEKPENFDNKDDGSYIYYDTSEENNERWRYTKVSSNSGEQSIINFNCYTISYYTGTTQYWLKYEDGGLVGTTIQPNHTDQELYKDYYFAFKDTANSKGVTLLSDLSNSEPYGLFVPNHDCYITASTSGTVASLTTTNSFDNALKFQVKGNETNIFAATNNSFKLLCSGTTVVLKNCTAGISGTEFNITGGSHQQSQNYTPTYNLVTDASTLKADDVITFLFKYDGQWYAIGTQSKNNRDVVAVSLNSAEDEITGDSAKLPNNFKLAAGTTSGSWTFQDIDTLYYLYAAGTSSTGSNYLRSQETLSSNKWGEWTVSISSRTATVRSVGNSNVPYMNFLHGTSNTGDYNIFRCSKSSSNSPQIFKRSMNTIDTIEIENCFIYSAVSTAPGTKSCLTYDVYYSETKPLTSPTILKQADASFMFATSQVSFRTATGEGYTLVTNASQLHAGDVIVIGCWPYQTVAGDITSTNKYLNSTDGEFSDDEVFDENLSIISCDNAIEFTLSGSTGAWVLNNGTKTLGRYSENNLCWETSDTHTSWTISISSDVYEATIAPIGGSTNERILYNGTSPRFKTYTSNVSNTMLLPEIYKKNSNPPSDDDVYIGDQIGQGYDYQYIDVVGSSTASTTFCKDYIQQTNTTVTYNALQASSAVALNSSFTATNYGNTTVIFVKNNQSRDLGNITFEYYKPSGDATPMITKGGGTGTSFESAGCSDLDPSGGYKYTLFLNSNNIKNLAYCGIDSNRKVYAAYNSDGTARCSGTYSENNVEFFVLIISNTNGSINITNVEYNFVALPGNTGNFGEVGYRSASYDSNGVFNGNNPQHTLDGTIVNFYYILPEGSKSSVSVEFTPIGDPNNLYKVYAHCTSSLDMYIFNYDIMVYTVKFNERRLETASERVLLSAQTYDPENGWIV